MNKIWKGRIKSDTDRAVENFTHSIGIDSALYLYDMMGTAAHVIGLRKLGIISSEELKIIIGGLAGLKQEIEKGRIEIDKYEDIHSLIENELYSMIGGPALKVHTGRSRNDQIVLDEKLFCRDIIISLMGEVISLMGCIIDISAEQIGTAFPAYTHMQKAQPAYLAHYLLSYFEKLARDCSRLSHAFENCDYMPLGAAACAGSGYKLDMEMLAGILRFKNISSNSMDIVGDRDFIVDLVYSCSMIMIHLSRFSEDLIIYNSNEFSYIDIEESFCTGSSIMPQKKNPDVLELIRGKSSLVTGNLMQIMMMLKALPSTYNRDLQEDKKVLFDAVGETARSISIFSELIKKIIFNKNIIKEKLKDGFIEATDMADYLVSRGEAFRNAHKVTGKIINYCIENNKKIGELTIDELKGFSKLFEDDIYEHINLQSCMESKITGCGTSKKSVRENIRKGRKKIKSLNKLLQDLKARTVDFESIIEKAEDIYPDKGE
jgi:argininosuccinate lyase